jgi:hypothetical protein
VTFAVVGRPPENRCPLTDPALYEYVPFPYAFTFLDVLFRVDAERPEADVGMAARSGIADVG